MVVEGLVVKDECMFRRLGRRRRRCTRCTLYVLLVHGDAECAAVSVVADVGVDLETVGVDIRNFFFAAVLDISFVSEAADAVMNMYNKWHCHGDTQLTLVLTNMAWVVVFCL